MLKIELIEDLTAYEKPILDLLERSDADFFPTLSSRLNFKEYVKKLEKNAFLVAAWESMEESLIPDSFVGAYIGYAQDGFDYAFGTYFWVDPLWRPKFVGLKLHKKALEYVKSKNKLGLDTKTWVENNTNLITFYLRMGYKVRLKTHDEKLRRDEVELRFEF